MVNDDVLYRFRLRLFSLAGGARQRPRGVPDRSGSTPRPTTAGGDRSCARGSRCSGRGSGGRPGCPTRRASSIEQRIVAFALGHPGLGPRRISATLAQERWGGIVVSPNGVWRVLRRHGLSRRISRLSPRRGLRRAARARAAEPPAARHVAVDHPGELVGFDCFHVGRLTGTAAGSGSTPRSTSPARYVWAELATTPLNPSRPEDLGPRPAGGGGPRAPLAGAWSGF